MTLRSLSILNLRVVFASSWIQSASMSRRTIVCSLLISFSMLIKSGVAEKIPSFISMSFKLTTAWVLISA